VTSAVQNPVVSTVDDTWGEPTFELNDDARAALTDAARVRWAGWLLPLDEKAGDGRIVPAPSGELVTRDMPLAFLWQKETSHGGAIVNGAVEVGAVTYADIRPNPEHDDAPWVWGTGYINLNDDDGQRLAQRLDDGMSRWVSVKLDYNPDFEIPVDENDVDDDGNPRKPGPTEHPDGWRLMNVTAESQPAFDDAQIGLLDDPDDVAADDEDDAAAAVMMPIVAGPAQPGQLVAATNTQQEAAGAGAEVSAVSTTISTTMTVPSSSAGTQPPEGDTGPASGGSGPEAPSGGSAGGCGSGDHVVAAVTGDASLPIAPRDTKWNGPAAAQRLVDWAGGRFKLDPAKMARVFLYRDGDMSPKMVTAWKFPIADIIGGQPKIVPAAVFAAAAILRGARGGTKIPSGDQQAMRSKLNGVYKRLRDELKDEKIRSPFEAQIHDGTALAMQKGDNPDKQPPWRRPRTHKRGRRAPANLTAAASSWAAQVAAAVPDEPPAEWFESPGLPRASKVKVTDEGRVYGYVASWQTDHAAYPGVKPPRNADGAYAKFHRHPVRTASGATVLTGPLATGGHAATDVALSIENVMAHYDDPTYVVADVRAGEDEHGIWVAGALRPGVSPFQVMLLDRYSISGDWRYGELLAACSVSVPGFHLDADDEHAALTAAACDAGVVDLPVLASATPAAFADASGGPAVLIAAGVVVDEDTTDLADVFTQGIDDLGHWLSGELTALRAELHMAEQAAAPQADQRVAELKNWAVETVKEFRAKLGLGPSAAAVAAAGSGQSPQEPAAPATEGDAPATPTPTPDPAPAAPAEPEGAPATEPATEPETPAGGQDAVAEFKTFFQNELNAIASEYNAAAPAEAPAAEAGEPDSAAFSALDAEIYGPQLDELDQLVLTKENV